ARAFSENIEDVEAKPVFEFANNKITLKSIDAKYARESYRAILNSKDFIPEKIEVAIQEKKVKFESASQMRLSLQNPNLEDIYQVEALAYRDGKEIKGQKFDDDIPTLLSKVKATKIDPKKWLFTIGIENYSETDNIKYSQRSALAFKKVAQKTLGIKERHSYTLIDAKATGTAIKNRLRLLLSEVKNGDTIYFYYNGHGIPDPVKGGEPYMLPSDGIPDFIVGEKVFSLKSIYKQLSDSKASKVVAFVDSCFSGATDGVSIIKGVAGSRLAPKKVIFDKSKMVVLTAGQKKQYSNMYEEKGHRMFSYFVMKSLLDGKKDVNMLYKEVSYKVSETSNELGALKKQEPTLDGNNKIRL
ncbi:MAG: caspase family protein, partial [Campylobacterota bacterium]|nr:caspase family protein [Campylobacterota bacterium]